MSDYHPIKVHEMEDGSGVMVTKGENLDIARSESVHEAVTLDFDPHGGLIQVEISALPRGAPRNIWPTGRFEVYSDEERLNGFHTREEAEECALCFPGSLIMDRADRFTYRPEDGPLLRVEGESTPNA